MGVTCAFSMALPSGFSMHTQSPSSMPYLAAVSGLICTSGLGMMARSDGTWRCSEWNDVVSRPPVVMTRGYSSAKSGRL